MSEQVKDLILQGHAVIRMENETMQSLSTARPRPSIKEILKAALDELEALPEFAAANYYVIPYREKAGDPNSKIVNVEGLSIKAAMVLQRHYRNAMAGAQITGEDSRSFQIQGAALDIENNIRVQRPRTVLKIQYDQKTRQEYRLSDQKMEQKLQSEISKAIRNAVLAIIPEPVKVAYWRRAKELAASGKSSEAKAKKPASLEERVAKMLASFGKLGVSQTQILLYLSKPSLPEVSEEDLGTLIGVWNAIQDGETTVADAFGSAEKKEPESEGVKDLSAVLGNGAPQAESPAKEERKKSPRERALQDLFGNEGELATEETSAESLAATRKEKTLATIEEMIRSIWKDFPGSLPPSETDYLSKIFTRAWNARSWEAVGKLPIEKLEKGLVQFQKDVKFVLDNIKKGAR